MGTGKQRAYTFVVTCEHASAFIPPELGGLGLDEEVLASHVAWDPGALEIASYLAEALDAPLFLGTTSRLVVDLNRSPGAPDVVPANAFGTPVPGNASLSAAERHARIEQFHAPYWSAVRTALEARLPQDSSEPRLVQLSIHSFTPELNGQKRELDLGVLYDPARPLEDALARALTAALSDRGFDTRLNQPYDGRADALVTANRAIYSSATYAGLELELSHRLLARLADVARAVELAVHAL